MHQTYVAASHFVVTTAGSMAAAGSLSLLWLCVVIKTQSGRLTHGTLPGPMYIIRLIGLLMFTPTVSSAGGQKGDLNFLTAFAQQIALVADYW